MAKPDNQSVVDHVSSKIHCTASRMAFIALLTALSAHEHVLALEQHRCGGARETDKPTMRFWTTEHHNVVFQFVKGRSSASVLVKPHEKANPEDVIAVAKQFAREQQIKIAA